jgi:hypothetical protein
MPEHWDWWAMRLGARPADYALCCELAILFGLPETPRPVGIMGTGAYHTVRCPEGTCGHVTFVDGAAHFSLSDGRIGCVSGDGSVRISADQA